MLGHPYVVAVRRVEGRKLGAKLGFPTLNFVSPYPEKVLPPDGVYAAALQAGGRTSCARR
jgi:FAD synthase